MLTREWLETFKRVLVSPTADHDLADMEGDSESQQDNERSRCFVRLRAGTAVKSDLCAGAKLLCKIEDDTEEVELVASVENACAVVVAGLGVGWIPAASVVSTRHVDSQLSETLKTNRRVKALVVDSTTLPCETRANGYDVADYNRHVDALVELLSIIGEPLESLHLPMLKLKTEHLGLILRYCPNLTELNVTGHRVFSISPLRENYASGNCKIETLSIAHGDSRYLQGSLTLEMGAILRGPGGRMLRRLAVQMLPPNWDTATQLAGTGESSEETTPFYQLIGTMETLEFVQLLDSTQEEQPPPAIDVSVHSFRFARMPLRSKLAFFCCLQGNGYGPSARNQLDASVLAQVLRFSGETIPRRVVMHAPFALQRCDCRECRSLATTNEFARLGW